MSHSRGEVLCAGDIMGTSSDRFSHFDGDASVKAVSSPSSEQYSTDNKDIILANYVSYSSLRRTDALQR